MAESLRVARGAVGFGKQRGPPLVDRNGAVLPARPRAQNCAPLYSSSFIQGSNTRFWCSCHGKLSGDAYTSDAASARKCGSQVCDLKHTPARSTSTGQSPAAMPESPRPPRHSIEGAEQLLQGRAAVLVQGVRVLFLLEQGVQVRCLLQATRWKAGAGKLLVVSVAGAVSSSEEGPCSDNNTRDYGR